MSSWLDLSTERQKLTEKMHAQYRKAKHKQEVINEASEQEKLDNIWKDALERGKVKGEVRLCWRDLEHVSDSIYNYHSMYGNELKGLLLDGIGLKTMERICQHCTHLEQLSLASNDLTVVDKSIQRLSKLTHLNLLCNSLKCLPPSVGQLVNLTRLDVANNMLVELPSEIGALRQLKHLNLESNELVALPASFGKLLCEVVNLNYNNFGVFPDPVLQMQKLRELSIMGNKLAELYSTLGGGSFKCLEVLHASRNRISILPDSIVDISSLTCIWADYNRLSALPPNFHRLRQLQVLKLEGNVDMIYPHIETVVLGVEEVLRWSRSRLETKKIAKVRHIVQSLEEVLTLIHRRRIGGELHESIFRVNGDSYQFPPDVLWSIFIPELKKIWSDPENTSNDGIKSFAFERHEVEQALFDFRDAAGPMVTRLPKARFGRCSCIQTGNRLQVCIPPKKDFMCTRPALLVRRKVAYEENMRAKRRLQEEERRIEDAAKVAEANAKSFCATDDGMIMVHHEAEKRLALSKDQPTNILARKSSAKSINKKVVSTIQSVRSQFAQTELRKLLEEEIKLEYISREVLKKKEQVIESNKRVTWIMKKWLGVTTDEVFRSWRDRVEVSRKQKRIEARKKLREERMRYEDAIAAYELKRLEFSAWHESWCMFQNVTIWINKETGEQTLLRPIQPLRPLMPESLVDATTGNPLTPRTIRDNEANISDESDDASYESSYAASESLAEDVTIGEGSHHSQQDTMVEAEPPRGRDEELQRAQRRVLERRIRLMQMGHF